MNRAAYLERVDETLKELLACGGTIKPKLMYTVVVILENAVQLLTNPEKTELQKAASNLAEVRKYLVPEGTDGVVRSALDTAENLLLAKPTLDHMPTWMEANDKHSVGEELTPLEQFVYYHEPDHDVEGWSKGLKKLLGIED